MKSPLIKPSHKGALHKFLGVPKTEKLSHNQIMTALGSPSPHVRKQAQFAINAAKWQH